MEHYKEILYTQENKEVQHPAGQLSQNENQEEESPSDEEILEEIKS